MTTPESFKIIASFEKCNGVIYRCTVIQHYQMHCAVRGQHARTRVEKWGRCLMKTSSLLGLLISLCAASACGSGTSSGTDPNELTAVTTAQASVCPNGGVTISTGLDVNNNGVLDISEITSTNNVCNGASAIDGGIPSDGVVAPGALVSTTQLAVGDANCPNGGTQIDTGIDNGAGGGIANDGVLEAGEISATQYVCNGTNGAGATSNSLIATTTLDVGDVHCSNGGTEIDVGIDNGAGGGTPNDGVLETGEFT